MVTKFNKESDNVGRFLLNLRDSAIYKMTRCPDDIEDDVWTISR